MDLIDLIITIAILGVGSLLAGGKKKPSGQKTAPRQSAPQPATPRRSVWETVMEMMGETVPTVEEEADEPAFADTFVEEPEPAAAGKEYFSYETQPVDWSHPTETESVAPLREEAADEEPLVARGFDLRQAFIYQTILENRYILDVK